MIDIQVGLFEGDTAIEVSHKGKKVYLGANDAYRIGIGLIQAAYAIEIEGYYVRLLRSEAVNYLQELSPILVPEVKPKIGIGLGLGLIECIILDLCVTLSPTEAISHGKDLIDASETAITNEALRHCFKDCRDMTQMLNQVIIIDEINAHRNKLIELR